MTLERQLVDIIKQIHDEKRLGDKRAEQFYNKTGGELTQGSVIFVDADGNLTEDNSKLFWDNANKRLGIGCTPLKDFDVNGDILIYNRDGSAHIWLKSGTDEGNALFRITASDNDNNYYFGTFEDDGDFIFYSYGIPGNVFTIAYATGNFTFLRNVFLSSIKSGATQAAAGAAANEIWKTNGHATLPDNVLMIGV